MSSKDAISMKLVLDRIGGVFEVGEVVFGAVEIETRERVSHQGLSIIIEGAVALQLSPKAVGIFEAFYHTIKPLQLISLTIPLAGPGKLPPGKTVIPFEFDLEPQEGSPGLFETYHGVFVNVSYSITVEMTRGMMKKNQRESSPFILVNPGQSFDPDKVHKPVPFKLEPTNLRNLRRNNQTKVPKFLVTGELTTVLCNIDDPFTGHVTIHECDSKIRSIEIQLVRVEWCAAPEGVAKEATEIQNIQTSDGDVARGFAVPLYMVMPRWFTCPTLVAQNFKVEFEVNLVIVLEDGHQITENFPIKLFRPPGDFCDFCALPPSIPIRIPDREDEDRRPYIAQPMEGFPEKGAAGTGGGPPQQPAPQPSEEEL